MRAAILTLAVLAACGSARAAADVDVIGPEFSMSLALLSDDGRAVAGLFHATAFHWTKAQGRTDIVTFPRLPSGRFELRALSADGSVVLLNLPDSVSGRPDQYWVPALWTREGGMRVADIPGRYVIAQDMSADGRTIVGHRLNSSFRDEVFRWSSDRGVETMPLAGDWQGYSWFDPGALSGDGRTVIGRASGSGVSPRVFVWQDGRSPFFIDAALGSALEAPVDVSHDGRRITGVIETASGERIHQAYVWDEAAGVRLLGLLPSMTGSRPSKISADGQVIVGETYGPGGRRNIFRWSEQTGTLSIQQWLAGYGVAFPIDPTWARVHGVSADGSVVAGIGFRDQIWVARVKGPSGGFLLDVAAYQRSLVDANRRLTLGLSGLANATLSGAHHRSLLDNGLVDESDRSCAWGQAEAADYDESRTRIEQAEVGVCTDLGPARLGLGLGKAKARQEWDLGSRSESEGEYLLGEAAFKLGEQWQASVLGYHGRFDVDSQRRYYNGTAVHASAARPDAKVSAWRARLDWNDAAQWGGVSVSPYLSYTWNKTELGAYREDGGGFPSRFERSDWTTRDARLGTAFSGRIGERNELTVSLEAVRRLDKTVSGVRGEIIDLFGFDLPGGEVDRNWGQALVDFDHRFGNGSVLGVGARAASSGGDADWGVSVGYRMAF